MSSPAPSLANPPPNPRPGALPDKGERPRAYQEGKRRFQWHFGAVPKHIRQYGKAVESPFRKVALFVVHGVGDQKLSETAATLRVNLEEAVGRCDPQNWAPDGDNHWIVPEPYIFDGHWANYQDFDLMAPEVAATLTEGPLDYFRMVWKKRTTSASGALRWLLRKGVALLWESLRKFRLLPFVYYLALIPLIWAIAFIAYLHPKGRKALEKYVGDVPLYTGPNGDVQNDVVQRIDQRMALLYLRLIGLDLKLDPLPREQWLMVSGERHRFDSVVWIGHSLGTVISYNVIGDLLSLAEETREQAGGQHDGADRLEQSLRAFITLGSPLDKIKFLFEGALRDWPKKALEQLNPAFRWQNFYYSEDPVSGSLDAFGARVENFHTRGFRVPAASHVYYWRDKAVLDRVLELAFEDPFVAVKPIRTVWTIWARIRLLGSGIVLLGALAAAVYFTVQWGLEKLGMPPLPIG